MTTPPKLLRAFALAVPLFLALGCNDDDNGGGPDVTLLVEAVLDGNGGIIVVTDGGVAVTAAEVTLNGTAGVAGATDGEYTVALAAPVAAGGVLTLDVSEGVAVVQGSGTVPEAPVITAPTNLQSFTSADPIEVTWTSTTDPTGFVVEAVGSAPPETFPVAGGGTARTHTIPAGTLAEGNWSIQVRAANLGTMSGDTETGSSMEIGAGAASPPQIGIGPVLLRIQGSDMGPEFNHVSLTLGGFTVDGATVTVNGEAALQAGAGDSYHVQLAAPVAVGDPLDLDVTVGADVYQGLGNVPEPPVVTAPANAAVFVVADPIQVDWTSTADPDRFAIYVDGPTGYIISPIAGNLRTYTFPAMTFTTGAYTISVFSYEDGVFTGVPVDVDSRMSIRGEQGPFPGITITP